MEGRLVPETGIRANVVEHLKDGEQGLFSAGIAGQWFFYSAIAVKPSSPSIKVKV